METYQVNSIPFNHSQLYIKTNYSCSDSNQKKKVNSNLKAEKKKISNQIFNVGFENYSVETLALMVQKNIKKNFVL